LFITSFLHMYIKGLFERALLQKLQLWFFSFTIKQLQQIVKVSFRSVWFVYVSAFRDRGSLSRRVNVPRAPAQMGRARGRARRGEARWPETGVREVEIPRPSCSSRAQVGCACSRGLQASTRVREASGPKRASVSSSSPRGQPSLRGPWSFLL
jgi:hypothetical protein